MRYLFSSDSEESISPNSFSLLKSLLEAVKSKSATMSLGAKEKQSSTGRRCRLRCCKFVIKIQEKSFIAFIIGIQIKLIPLKIPLDSESDYFANP